MPTKDITDTDDPIELIARNKRARHDYEILDTWETGIVLAGTEVKALREGRANLTDAFGIVKDQEVYLLNLHIGAFTQGTRKDDRIDGRNSGTGRARALARAHVRLPVPVPNLRLDERNRFGYRRFLNADASPANADAN